MLTHLLKSCMLVAMLSFATASALGAGEPSPSSTADHKKFKVLQEAFPSGPSVTTACLTCHTEAARKIQQTQHWTWEYVNPDTKQVLGKRHIVNNFCTSVESNYESCATCHIGYGLNGASFDFSAEKNVDCLVCHDTTGRYTKQTGMSGNVVTKEMEFPPGSGKIVKPIDLSYIAQRVGRTSRATCGSCHFNGGGGDGVKHGDLDTSLEAPEKALDVHMDADGNNFSCTTCHRTSGHRVPGSRYAPTAVDTDRHIRGRQDAKPMICQACHGPTPHQQTNAILDQHTQKLACQTCHVPAMARGGIPTKLSWDWSTAGQRDPDGKPLIKKNAEGHVVYNGIKGTFEMGENVVPEYMWFNGTVKYTLLGDKIEKGAGPVPINYFEGSPSDGKSRIWPVKVFRGKQAYDPVNKSLVVTHLAGNDDTAYWTNLNWEKAIAVGMATVKQPFSGTVDFIDTVSMWPITHMVAPKEKALACTECHKANGRLAKVPGINVPIFGATK